MDHTGSVDFFVSRCHPALKGLRMRHPSNWFARIVVALFFLATVALTLVNYDFIAYRTAALEVTEVTTPDDWARSPQTTYSLLREKRLSWLPGTPVLDHSLSRREFVEALRRSPWVEGAVEISCGEASSWSMRFDRCPEEATMRLDPVVVLARLESGTSLEE